jgi:hypothetical protein
MELLIVTLALSAIALVGQLRDSMGTKLTTKGA